MKDPTIIVLSGYPPMEPGRVEKMGMKIDHRYASLVAFVAWVDSANPEEQHHHTNRCLAMAVLKGIPVSAIAEHIGKSRQRVYQRLRVAQRFGNFAMGNLMRKYRKEFGGFIHAG